ncbi:MAG: NUDIX domain-containing protein [Patescibacteria group bacterium]
MEKETKEKRQTKKNLKFSREFSAGGVVVKTSQNLWLVTKSAKSKLFPKSFWRLPKGWLDDRQNGKTPGPLASGEKRASQNDLENAAQREVREEAGVDAKILQKIGSETYFLNIGRRRILKFVTFFLMEWEKDFPEGPGFETEEVLWLSYAEACNILTHKGEKEVLHQAKEILDRGIQSVLI